MSCVIQILTNENLKNYQANQRNMLPYARDGGTRRCYYEFQTLVACYTAADTHNKKQCTPQFDDYDECLHGTKERARARLMMQQLKENEITKNGVVASDLYRNSGSTYANLDIIKD